jgi:hypothetical protein
MSPFARSDPLTPDFAVRLRWGYTDFRCRLVLQEAIDFNGAPEGIRTPDPQIRSLVLFCLSKVAL